ncbi:hypothetical protein N7527_009914 [Penicillium freii]|nr:hypothetical protein N7527_009914 [Penicillium freii]
MVSPSLACMTGQAHITGLPMPKNLSESKVYDTTNTLQNPKRSIVAIFETADAAGRAIAASPTENY